MLLSPFAFSSIYTSLGIFSSILHLHYLFQRRKCSSNTSPDHAKLAEEENSQQDTERTARLLINTQFSLQLVVLGLRTLAEIQTTSQRCTN